MSNQDQKTETGNVSFSLSAPRKMMEKVEAYARQMGCAKNAVIADAMLEYFKDKVVEPHETKQMKARDVWEGK